MDLLLQLGEVVLAIGGTLGSIWLVVFILDKIDRLING